MPSRQVTHKPSSLAGGGGQGRRSCCLSNSSANFPRRAGLRGGLDLGPALSPPPEGPAPGRASAPPHLGPQGRQQRQLQAPAGDHTVTRAHSRLHLTFGDHYFSPGLTNTSWSAILAHSAHLPCQLPCPPHPLPKLTAPRSQAGAGYKVEEVDPAVPGPGPS